ncbi:Rz1-like lysis system protein LysC [Neisseria sp. S1]|uniref:Rz1-like lysis system protein LysC n=1 Tax=Neisseria sp. S1 TaxID=3318354 RepID=UPI003A8A4A2C
MMTKYKPLLMAITAILLSACALRQQPEYQPLKCPPVPECRQPVSEVRTNADLAAALIDTRVALDICKVARDTLQTCINNQEAKNND